MVIFRDPSLALFAVAAICYCIAAIYGLLGLLRPERFRGFTVELILFLGFILQTTALFQRSIQTHSCPIGNPFETVQFMTWSMMFLNIIIGKTFRHSVLGVFTGTSAAILSVIALNVNSWDYLSKDRLFGGNPWIEAHASLAMCSYGFFLMLALTSIMYLLQNYGLKHKRFLPFLDLLPSIYKLERINFRLLLCGNLVYTTSLLIGGIFWYNNPDHILFWKIFFAVSAWLGYTLLLFLRGLDKILARRMAWACIFLCIWALLTLWPVELNRDHKQDTLPTESISQS
jgi:ABC-type uncharacterized transport system permease subunit